MNKLLEFYENHMVSCFYMKHFGIECPGCGFQRGLFYLLKGNVMLSIKTYPALIPILVMLAYLGLHLIIKFKNGHKVLIWLFVLNTGIIVFNYIFNILSQLA